MEFEVNMKKLLKLILTFAAGLTVSSCATMRNEVNVSSSDAMQEDGMTHLEKTVAEFDALTFSGGSIDESASEISKAIEDAKKSASSVQKAQYAKLQSLRGRIYLMEGKRQKAKDCYTDALVAYKGDVQTIILGSRLGLVTSLDEESTKLSSSSDKALLVLEKALALYGEEEYLKAVSQFDTSFISLPDFYKSAYKEIRDRAWNLRNISSSGSVDALLKKDRISVGEMLVIAKNYSSAFDSVFGGAALSQNALYRKTCALGFLSSAKDSEVPLPLEKDTVNRTLAARFLWNLHAYRKGLEEKTPYTERFSSRKKSPVQDVPFESSDFDAIMASVEKEYLNLSDGIHFEPTAWVSAVQFSEAVRKVE